MSLRTQRALQALILAGLGLLLLEKIWSGTLFFYINQRFVVLVLLAAVGLLGLASTVFPRRANPAGAAEEPDARDHASHGLAPGEALHSRAASASSAVSGWSLVILAIPIIVGVLVPPRPLGASAIANKGLNTTTPLSAGGSAPVQLDMAPTDRSVLDWLRAFNAAGGPAELAGQAADVIGFVYRDPHLPADEFLVSRFAVTCCSADATAVGLLVRWPGAAGLADNVWVRVRGPVVAAAYAGRGIPRIVAEAVDGVEAPGQPYLYP